MSPSSQTGQMTQSPNWSNDKKQFKLSVARLQPRTARLHRHPSSSADADELAALQLDGNNPAPRVCGLGWLQGTLFWPCTKTSQPSARPLQGRGRGVGVESAQDSWGEVHSLSSMTIPSLSIPCASRTTSMTSFRSSPFARPRNALDRPPPGCPLFSSKLGARNSSLANGLAAFGLFFLRSARSFLVVIGRTASDAVPFSASRA